MTFLGWMALVGALFLVMALSSAQIRRLPISTAAIYLGLGIALGPAGFGVVNIDVYTAAPWLERVAEIAVIMSLFVGGLRLRLPVRDAAWRAAYRLAGPVMLASILGVAAFAHYALGLDAGFALLAGALLAPTDPVLAGAVAVNDAADHDRMRYGLSGEAGLNDGMAFPFVIFAMLWIEGGGPGNWIPGWFLHRILWAVPAGLAVGYVLGRGIGRLAIALRTRHRDTAAPNDFLALALIALAYVATESIGAWGFLAVFAAGVGLRHEETATAAAERRADGEDPREDDTAPHLAAPPAEHRVGANVEEHHLENPVIAAGVLVGETLSFGDTAGRLLEVILVALVGVLVSSYWDPRAIPLAFVMFVLVRPLATRLMLRGTRTTTAQRWLMGWFGLRGIGTVYYLCYVLAHGVSGPGATELTALAISVVALSIVVHGTLGQPVLDRYDRAMARREQVPTGAASDRP